MSGDHNMYQKTKSYLDDFECPRCGHCCQALETEREWVGLTDEEVSDVIDDVLEGGGWLDVARALEAAIKDKNKW